MYYLVFKKQGYIDLAVELSGRCSRSRRTIQSNEHNICSYYCVLQIGFRVSRIFYQSESNFRYFKIFLHLFWFEQLFQFKSLVGNRYLHLISLYTYTYWVFFFILVFSCKIFKVSQLLKNMLSVIILHSNCHSAY